MAEKILRKFRHYDEGILASRKLENLLSGNAILQALSISIHYGMNTSYNSIFVITNRLRLKKLIDQLRD